VVQKVRYVGHIIRNDLSDDDDVCSSVANFIHKTNVLAHTFHMCKKYVKTALFRADYSFLNSPPVLQL